MNKLLIICGPTASGKTALAVECAKKLNSEVISADSMNVYRDFNIGTAKPTTEEQQGIKHHLIDVVDGDKNFSVGDYKELAMPIIEKLNNEGKIPVICGGTGFYINSLIYNMSYGNSKQNLEAREKYFNLAKEFSNEYVYNILLRKDPLSAEKIHKNDIKRVVRALEIYDSGYIKSEIQDDLTPICDYKAYTFDFPREELYNRIDFRVDNMIKSGLIEEVISLKEKGLTLDNQAMQGIGYKEIYSYLENKITLEEAIKEIKLNTRHYAKRQITFFKRLPNLQYIKPGNIEEIAERITKL